MTDERIPWWEPALGKDVRSALLDTFDSGFINEGKVSRALGERLAGIVGVRYGVATTSCTSALAISLMAAGVGPGDEVIVPDLTFIATANAVKLAGADVRLVDVEPGRFTLDADRARAAIGPRTRAIVTVDVNGRAPAYEAIEP